MNTVLKYLLYVLKISSVCFQAMVHPLCLPHPSEEAGERQGGRSGEALRRGGVHQAATGLFPGPNPTPGPCCEGRNKSYSLGHYSGEKAVKNLNMVLSSEVGGVGCSLLDMDTEGQKRDCTVPLCRIQSSPARPSVFELEKEFLS